MMLPPDSSISINEFARFRETLRKDGSYRVPIFKFDSFRGLVYGVVLEPGTIDSQNDTTSEIEIEKACHDFMLRGHRLDLQHRRDVQDDEAVVIENYIAPVDFGDVTKGSWVMGVLLKTEELKKQAQDGDIGFFSIRGTGVRKEVKKGLSIFTDRVLSLFKGGPGSGNRGHKGYPGRGGSSPKAGGPSGGNQKATEEEKNLIHEAAWNKKRTLTAAEHANLEEFIERYEAGEIRDVAKTIRTDIEFYRKRFGKIPVDPKAPKPKVVEEVLDSPDQLATDDLSLKASEGLSDEAFENYFREGMGESDWRDFDWDETQQIKQNVVNRLSKATGVSYEEANDFVKQWALTSNDSNPKALQIQEETAKMFGVELSGWQKERITAIGTTAAEGSVTDTQKILRSMYNETQNQLIAAKIETITVYRGVQLDKNTPNSAFSDNVELNALSSWSANYDTAENFAKYLGEGSEGGNKIPIGQIGVVMSMEVPRQRILSTPKTGFGCMNEWEVVVIAGTENAKANVVEKWESKAHLIDAPWPGEPGYIPGTFPGLE